jgi:hypothetical protein
MNEANLKVFNGSAENKKKIEDAIAKAKEVLEYI